MKRKRAPDILLVPVMASAPMRRIEAMIRKVATKDVVVTFIGESGTGKEVLARRAHDLSQRRTGPFVPINCAAIPEALFESELFGHERGSFTGASERSQGKIELAQGGTLFLDEIGELPLAVQAKLLRFVENRRFMRIGGAVKLDADVRLMCATLRPLEAEVAAGRFRSDLYYRVQGITIDVPPLRARPSDIAELLSQFIAVTSARHGTVPPTLDRGAKAALRSYSWPGNVRELKNVVERLCLLNEGARVTVADLPRTITSAVSDEADARETLTLRLDRPLAALTEAIIDHVLALEGGNRTRAARRLGVSARTIQRHLSGSTRK